MVQTDPPGNAAYNTAWFRYWNAVSDYLGANPDYAAKGYYHIVNEPQTFSDYDIVAYLVQQTKLNAPNARIMVSDKPAGLGSTSRGADMMGETSPTGMSGCRSRTIRTRPITAASNVRGE